MILGMRYLTCGVLLALACSCGSPQLAVDTGAEETAIRDADAAWSKAVTAKQLDATVAFYADDASILSPNMPIITGKEAIRKNWMDEFAPAFGLALGWQAVKVAVARSGDLGYSEGTYQATFNDPKGNPVRDHGKYLAVWKKHADGKWKVIADMYNTDLPPPSPPAK